MQYSSLSTKFEDGPIKLCPNRVFLERRAKMRTRFPCFMERERERRGLIEKCNLDDVTPLSDWMGVVAALAKLGWDSPIKLAQASSGQISAGLLDGPTKFLDL